MRFLRVLVFVLLGAGSAVAKECRMPDVPPGVRVQAPPGCREPVRSGASTRPAPDRMRAENGFVDLGNGTKVKVSGRVRAEMGFRR